MSYTSNLPVLFTDLKGDHGFVSNWRKKAITNIHCYVVSMWECFAFIIVYLDLP